MYFLPAGGGLMGCERKNCHLLKLRLIIIMPLSEKKLKNIYIASVEQFSLTLLFQTHRGNKK